MKEVTIYTEHNEIPPSQVVFSVKYISTLLEKLPNYSKVAIVMEKTPTFVACVIACLNRKITFSPFDPDSPALRTEKLLGNFQPDLILTDQENFESTYPIQIPTINYKGEHSTSPICLNLEEDPNHSAYVIYTSGSTGEPKGVEVGINSLKNYLTDSVNRYRFDDHSNIGCLSATHFDLAYTALLLPFVNGGSLSLFNSSNYAEIFDRVLKGSITHLKITPGHAQILNELEVSNSQLQTLIIGGEQLLSEHISNLVDPCDVYNEYGPTEATIGCSTHLVNKNDVGEISIGEPIKGVQYKTTHNKNNQLELYIGGDCLAKGYWKDEVLTAENFLEIDHITWYKTGDVVEYRNEQLFFVGRSNEVQKIKGYRVNPLEITQTLLEFENVLNAFSTVHPQQNILISFVVSTLSEDEILSKLKENLPQYALPSTLFFVEEIPLTKNGKTNAKLLLDQIEEKSNSLTSLHEIWSKVLNNNQFQKTDSFFNIGGTSLLALQTITHIESDLKKIITPLQFYQNSTFEAMEHFLKTEELQHSSGFQWINSEELIPTQTQKALGNWQKIHPDNTAYNEVSLFEIDNQIEKKILNTHLETLLNVNNVFNIQFDNDYSIIEKNGIHKIELTSIVSDTLNNALSQFNKTFSTGEYLYKFSIIIAYGKRYLACVFHHAVSDFQTQQAFFENIDFLLKNAEVKSPKHSWKDYSKSILSKLETSSSSSVWEKMFHNAESKNFIGSHLHHTDLGNANLVSIQLTQNQTKNINNQLKEHNLTVANYFHYAFNVLLSKYFNENYIAHAVPVSLRDQPGMQNICGPLVNTLPFAFQNNNKESVLQNMKAQSELLWQCLSAKHDPIHLILENAGISSFQKVLDVLFVVQENNKKLQNLHSVRATQKQAKAVLQLEVINHKDQIVFNFDFEENSFSKEEQLNFSSLFINLTEQLFHQLQTPFESLSLLDELSIQQRRKANATHQNIEHTTIIDALIERSKHKPFEAAITHNSIALNNEEFNQYTNTIAELLDGKSGNIGIIMNRGLHQIMSVFGVLKAGLSFVPISPDFPEQHIQNIINTAEIDTVLYEEKNPTSCEGFAIDIQQLTKKVETINKSSIEQSAYILFTSGTTGNPKGVDIQHHALMNRISWGAQNIHTSEEVILHKTPVTFDVSIAELFGWIIGDHQLMILNHLDEKRPEKISKSLLENQIDHVHFVPGMLNLFLSYQEQNNTSYPKLKRVICSGETLSSSTVKWFKELNPTIEIWNLYGPTETTVEVSYKKCSSHEEVNLGVPINNSSLYVLDQNLQELPIGIQGDLYIGGQNLAKGYYNNRKLTEASFIELNIDNRLERIYKSGDRAVRLSNGEIQFKGRQDDQLKINGVRIEIPTIKEVISQVIPLNCFEVFARKTSRSTQLICAITKKGKSIINITQLKEYIQDKLPVYYCPEIFIEIDQIPFTKSGKIDLSTLENLTITEAKSKLNLELNERQRAILKIVQKNLLKPNIGIEDDYFENGGNSFNLLSLASDIESETGAVLNINSIFHKPSISTLLSDKNYQNKEDVFIEFGEQSKQPIFCFPPAAGYGLIYQQLANKHPSKRFVCFNFKNTNTLIDNYINKIKSENVLNPILIGYSGGGNIAFEVAKRLKKEGIHPRKIILIDSYLRKQKLNQLSPILEDLKNKLIEDVCSRFEKLDTKEVKKNINDYYDFFWLKNKEENQVDCEIIHIIADNNNLADITDLTQDFISNNWENLTNNTYTSIVGKGDHKNMLYSPNIEYNSKLILDSLEAVTSTK